MIKLERVCKSFGDQPVLRDISFQVEKGEFLVVLGSSGAGKSTLMRCMNGLVPLSGGTIAIEGLEVRKSNLRKVRQKVGFIFQQFHVIGNLTVLQNVLIGLLGSKKSFSFLFSGEERKAAIEAVEAVGLSDKLHSRVDRLSGGQKQRVAIARVLAQKPDVILADEPVSNLDPVISREILDLLKHINRSTGAVILCNLHQLEYALEYADRIVGIRDGIVQFDGLPSAIDEREAARIYGSAVAKSADDREIGGQAAEFSMATAIHT